MKKYLPLLLITLAFNTSPVYVNAQNALGISAIPPRLEIKVSPGKTITKEIKVRNDSAVEKVISSQVKDFVVVDDTGTPLQIEDPKGDTSNRWAASSWIHLSNSNIRLKPGETKSLMVTIIPPENALPGGHYAMILHSPNNETTLSETGSLIQANVGTLVYITIPGKIKESATVKEFFAPAFSEYGPISFKTIITNLSDIHITPVGRIAITNSLGLKTATLNLENVNIFPYTNREYNQTLDSKLMLGRYKANLLATYGTTGQLITATIFFWVIPWKLLLTLAGIATILLVIIKLKKDKTSTSVETNQKVEELEQEIEILKKKYRDRK